MRRKVKGLVDVRAVSGTHGVFLAFDMRPADIQGLLGFAIARTDLVENETVWLRGNKTFASVRAASGAEDVSSREHPFQAFQWADYSAKPGYSYRYRVVPMFGRPGALTEQRATTVTIATEPLKSERHEVHFNRGAIASQAFTRRFAGQTLEQAGAPAYQWLGRDLVPALLAFIAKARNRGYSLHAALFELNQPDGKPWADVLAALKAASASGADVQILYHALDDVTGRGNARAIAAAGIAALCRPRTRATLMHNKFIVLSRNKKPIAVWSGSTNISRNALYGQLNLGHVYQDDSLARQFFAYWQMLAQDPQNSELKDWAETHNPLPPATDTEALTAIFSPRRGREVFDWWITLAATPRPLFMTFPFGIVKDFRPVFDKNDGVLRFALLDKYVNGGNAASRAAAIAEIERIRRWPNIGMALGNNIFVDWVDGWHREESGLGLNVNWVHTKFMLIDPLGKQPITLSGSANFSVASVTANDENMVLIRGDKRVADIYFSEFMRIFGHHRFRESVKRHIEQFGSAAFNTWRPQDLFENWQQWAPQHFRAHSEHDIKRRYFAGL